MIAFALSFAAASSDLSVAEQRRMTAEFAACTVKYEPEIAAKAVLEQWRNHQLINHRVLIFSDCLPRATGRDVRLTARGPTLLYALADALIDREPTLNLSNLEQVRPLEHRAIDEEWFARLDARARSPDQKADVEAQRQRAQGDVALSRFGECIVRHRPADVLALVRTRPASPEEKAAFAGVTTALGYCISEGASIKMSRDVVRGTLALNLYRLAKAPRVAAAVEAAR